MCGVIQRFQTQFSLALIVTGLTCFGVASAAGLLRPANGSLPALEIKSHEVQVVIEDGYAVTQVEQVFSNPNGQDLEAIYSFPVPKAGSVAEFTVWIDGQPVTGEVLEKKEARKIYEEEKQAGRDAGLTEKDEYRTFDVHVSPVRAGQDTRIRLVYLQPAEIDTGIGRYVYPLEEGGVDEQKLNFWTANDKVKEKFSFDLKLKSAYPVDAVRMPNKAAAITQVGAGEWNLQLQHLNPIIRSTQSNEQAGIVEGATTQQPTLGQPVYELNGDLIVYWRLAENLPGSVDLIAHKEPGARRGTFMMVLTPGDDLQPIQEGKDWIFVLDISGSMQGKYAALVDGVQQAFSKMRPTDRFRIVLFNSQARELTSGWISATPEMVQRYGEQLTKVQPNQGTNLYAGLSMAIKQLTADRTAGVVLVTDGVANIGETQQKGFHKLLKQRDVRLFTFIMGNSANQPLLESLAKVSNGFALNVSNSDDIVGKLLQATGKISHQALHGVKLEIDGVRTAELTPDEIGSLYRGQQLVMFGHYWGSGEADVKLKGRISGQEVTYQTRFTFPEIAQDNPEIERLWAYSKIRNLQSEIDRLGEEADLKQAITDLGVEYGLVTDYTSMLVLRDEVFLSRGIERKNQQRLKVEAQAQQQRAARPAVSRRVDQQQPMYRSSRPTFSSGGGALDIYWLLLFMPLMIVLLRNRADFISSSAVAGKE